MTVSVNCPNPQCKHHEKKFSVELESPIAKKGGNARWKNMTKAERDTHINRMTKARLRKMKEKK